MREQLSWCTRDRFTPGIQARTCERTVMAALIRGSRLDVGHSCQHTDQIIQVSKQEFSKSGSFPSIPVRLHTTKPD